jgi:uncharacterized membrane protein
MSEISAEAGAFVAALTSDDTATWVDARVKAAVDEAVPRLVDAAIPALVPALISELMAAVVANEAAIMTPLTAYMDTKIAQIEEALPDILKQAIHGWRPFEVAPEEEK